MSEFPSYVADWEALQARDLEYLIEHATAPIEPPAPLDVLPGFRAGSETGSGLLIHYISPSHRELAPLYWDKAIRIAEREFASDRFNRGEAAVSFPQNRGEVFLAYAYACALKQDAPPDATLALKAAADCAACAAGRTPFDWDADAQSWYLPALELLAIAEQFDELARLLKEGRQVRAASLLGRFRALKAIVKAKSFPLTDEKVRQGFRAVFDIERDPLNRSGVRTYCSGLRLLGLGMVWVKFFEHAGHASWAEGIEAVRA